MFTKQLQKANEKGKGYATIRHDTAYKTIQNNNCTIVCDYHYTDDYAYDNANGYGKGEIAKEHLLQTMESMSPRCYISVDSPNRLKVSIHSNLMYSVHFNETEQQTDNNSITEAPQTNGDITVTYNNELNGIEITFTSKPNQSIIDQLKDTGYKWHNVKKLWYAKKNSESKMFAESLQSTQEEKEEMSHNSQSAIDPTNDPITQPTKTNGDKIKVKEIKFLWSESLLVNDNQTVSTFVEAEQIINNIANHIDHEGYDKTKFLITWEDGHTYTGRIDVMSRDKFNQSPLKSHIEDHCLFYAGLKKPSHYTDEDYISTLKAYNITDEEKQEYISFLDTYALTDMLPTDGDKKPNNSNDANEPTKNNVIPFSRIIDKKAEKVVNSITPKEWLMAHVLKPFINDDDMADLLTKGLTIEEIFEGLAVKVYEQKEQMKRMGR
jgi:hypothetical protein